jgi:Putative prokaryotic signal transducing protein
MRELMRTSDPVLAGFVLAVLRDAGIHAVMLDENMSILEGSIGALPRRVMVDAEALTCARRVMREAGLERELADDLHGDQHG